MKMEHILKEVEEELAKAKNLFPRWQPDPVHGAAIVAEEAGEACQAALNYYYDRGGAHQLKTELIHTVAMAMRFLMNFEASESWMEAFKKGRKEALEAQEKLKGEKDGEGKI